jgi:hypothetical protein
MNPTCSLHCKASFARWLDPAVKVHFLVGPVLATARDAPVGAWSRRYHVGVKLSMIMCRVVGIPGRVVPLEENKVEGVDIAEGAAVSRRWRSMPRDVGSDVCLNVAWLPAYSPLDGYSAADVSILNRPSKPHFSMTLGQ